jgi:hypothetical protein
LSDYLIKQMGSLFTKKRSLDSLWQEIADHFYPERADFTIKRHIGEEFADHLMSGYPVQARRDLGDSFSSMLRRGNEWFSIKLEREERETLEIKQWLEWATGLMQRAMHDRGAKFIRATKEGDHDFAAFGQCVISVELNHDIPRLLYRAWHLRDCAWMENQNGDIDTFYRKWPAQARSLVKMFKNVHPSVVRAAEKDPFKEIPCFHCLVPGDSDKDPAYKSVYMDIENKQVMEEVKTNRFSYVIPRWSTVSGSQYAYSPAVIAALPDARLIQSVTLTLLEAGEKYTNPPLLATQEAIRSDVNLMAGGITWVDSQYDERLGEVLRPISQDRGGFPIGFNMRDDVKSAINSAFYLDKLALPPQGDMTAFEVSKRVQEYIRQALPLFEPMETEYNSALCDSTFELLQDNNAFGNKPKDLIGQDIRFQFDSPLQQSSGEERAIKFQRMIELMGIGSQVEQTLPSHVDIHSAFRDALEGAGVPAGWMNEDREAREAGEEQKEIEEGQELLETIGQMASG